MEPELGDHILCRASVELPLSTDSGEIMYLPGGEHAIMPFGGGVGKPINIAIDATSAAELERERAAIKKTPYFDFNHEDREASFWPTGFVWRDGDKPGVYAKGEWSQRGKESVSGKAYKYFSPVFFVDNKHATPAKVVCRESAAPNMGGLTNDPAFHKILPLWAKSGAGLANADGPNAGATNTSESALTTKEETTMTNEEVAALQAKQEELEEKVAQLQAKADAGGDTDEIITSTQAELRATQAELLVAKRDAKIAEQEEIISKRSKADADAAIKAAILRGAIMPKDVRTQEKLRQRAIADPSFINDVIDKMQGPGAILGSRLTVGGGRVTVSNEDPVMVFGKMTQIIARNSRANFQDRKRGAREIAAIYAAELSPEINGIKASRLLSMPLNELAEAIQATDVTDGSLETLAGVLVTQRTLELLKFSFPSLGAFTTDFSDQPATYGQTVITRTVSVPNVVTYNTTTGWAAATAATDDVPVAIDSHKGVPIEFNEQILASTVRRLFDEFAPASAYALAKALVDDLYSNITDANFTNNTVATVGAFARATVSAVGTALDLRGVPMGLGMRTMLLYPTFYEKIVNDTIIATMGAYSKNELITNPTNGVELAIPVDAFRIIKAPNMPTNDGNVVGFAGSKSSLCIVTRTPNDYTSVLPGANNGSVQMVTDPDLGITVMLVQFVNHTLGRAQSRIALMWGTAAGQGNAGQLIKAKTGSGSSQTS